MENKGLLGGDQVFGMGGRGMQANAIVLMVQL